MKAREVMTPMVITCSPETSVAEVAKLMRDRNLGDILITDDGKLVGIVTDRDIAVRVAATANDIQVPVKHYMSKRVVTGNPNWDVDRLAKTMGHHQIRRLPIVENGLLMGIVSLGDLALRSTKRPSVTRSLKEISEPQGVHRLRSRGRGRTLGGLMFGLLAVTAIALVISSKSGWTVERLQDSKAANMLMDAIREGRDRLSSMSA